MRRVGVFIFIAVVAVLNIILMDTFENGTDEDRGRIAIGLVIQIIGGVIYLAKKLLEDLFEDGR